MNYKGDKKDSRKDPGEQAASVMDVNRRESGRHVFMAEAEVFAVGSGVRFSTRITDLGLGGCFVDTLSPLPIGAKVQVIVHQGKTHLDTDGVVVYSQAGLGMGVAFEELAPEQRKALDAWLAGLTSERRPSSSPPHTLANRTIERNTDHDVLVRLVKIMVKRGLITPSDANSLLKGFPIV